MEATPDVPDVPKCQIPASNNPNFRGLQDKLKLLFGGAIALSVLILLVVWFMLMNAGVQISRARKTGEWKQRECGAEHMEAETARHEIAMTFNGEVKQTLYATIVLLLVVGLFFLVPVILFGFTGWRAMELNPKMNFTQTHKIATFVISALLVSHLSSFIGIWGAFMNHKSYTEPTDYESAKSAAKKTTDAFISFTFLGIAGAVALFALLRGCMTDALPLVPRVALTVIFAAAMTVVTMFNHEYTVLSGYINEYRKKTNVVNLSLKTLINDASNTALQANTSGMLKQNIHRLDTDSSNNPDLNSSRYSENLYAYTFHKDGEEGDFMPNRSGMLKHIKTLDGVLTSLYNAYKSKGTLNESFLNQHTKASTALEHVRTLVTLVTAAPEAFEITDAISELEKAFSDLCKAGNSICSPENFATIASTIQSLRDTLLFDDELPSESIAKLSTAVRELNTSKLPEESSTFVNRVFWGSVVVLGLLSFIPFHFMYRRYSDLMTIISVAVIAFFLFVLSVYGWFMGQTTAV